MVHVHIHFDTVCESCVFKIARTKTDSVLSIPDTEFYLVSTLISATTSIKYQYRIGTSLIVSMEKDALLYLLGLKIF